MGEYNITAVNGTALVAVGNLSTLAGNQTLVPVGRPVLDCFPGVLPAALYIKVWEIKHVVMISIAVVLTALIVGLFLDSLTFLNGHIPLKRRRSRILWIMGIYPVFAVTSLMALFMPRASILTGFTASIYLSVALYQFMLLVLDYFGGSAAMVTMLKGQEMMIGTPPVLIFCCCCLPKVPVTRKSILWIRRLTLQVAFVRPVVLFISAVMWADGSGLYTPGKFSPKDAFLYLNVASLISTLTAFQCIVILFKVAKEPLKNYRIVPKFFSVQLALIFSNLQSVLIGFLIGSGRIPCSMTFSRTMNGQFIHNFALIIEMFLFAVLARISYRKRDGNLDYVAPPRPSFFRPKSFAPTYPERNGDVESYLKFKGEYDGIDDNSNSPNSPGLYPPAISAYPQNEGVMYVDPTAGYPDNGYLQYSVMKSDDDLPRTDL